ncbi:MAG: S41 family peptidase [Defluviitaleaceae bacterium]|nr:S41 family peptidase [Defluviitaleaceae bacterium]
MKRIFALTLVLVLFLAVPQSLEASNTRSPNQAAVAGLHLAEIIDLIVTQYVGDPVTVNELLEAAIHGMTELLDRYSVYLSPQDLQSFTESLSGQLVGIGVSMANLDDGGVVIMRVLPDSPAQRMGVLLGDIIVSVDGHDATNMTVDQVRDIILNPETTSVVLQLNRNGTNLTLTVPKEEIRSSTVITDRLTYVPEAQGLPNLDNFRYIQISSIAFTTGDDLRRSLAQIQSEGVEGIIIDFRGNAGGYLDVAIDIAGQLVPSGPILHTVNSTGRRLTYSSFLNQLPFDNVVVLVNRFTASAPEVISSALQDSQSAIIVGETTFGKGLVQSVHSLRNGGALVLTTEEYFRRNGGVINDIGVIPDVAVQQTDSDQDDVLRRGLEILINGL